MHALQKTSMFLTKFKDVKGYNVKPHPNTRVD